jgi:hypothetical protein
MQLLQEKPGMAEPHVIAALRSKRAELAGVVSQLERQLSRQQADLTHLDATLRMFDPTIRLSAIRPRRQYVRNTWFRHGECLRLIYDALREIEKPVTTRELAERIMQIKAIPATEARTRDLVQRTLLASLNRAKDTIARSDAGGVVAWRLI